MNDRDQAIDLVEKRKAIYRELQEIHAEIAALKERDIALRIELDAMRKDLVVD